MKLHRHNVLRITGCPDPLLWYSGLVGYYVPHEGFDVTDGFRSREKSGHVNFVRTADAKPQTVLVTEASNGKWPYLTPVSQTQLAGSYSDPLPLKKPTAAPMPQGQSHRDSVMEAVANIAIGFVVSVAITAVLLPAMGHQVSGTENLLMTSVFTVASLLRSYGVRRVFNWLQHRKGVRHA